MPASSDPQLQSLLYFLDETYAEASKRLVPLLGKPGYVLVSFERWFELFVSEADVYLMAALSADTDIRAIPELSVKMRELLLKPLQPSIGN